MRISSARTALTLCLLMRHQHHCEEFDAFLRSALVSHGIRGIAEEMSRAALKKHFRSGESVPCRLATAVDLPYRYCDPDPETQKALNITSDSERENYWIKELITFDTFPVLFVLGACHVDSFERLLSDSDFQPLIIARDWKASSDRNETIQIRYRPRRQ